jgi:hypothetical protein
LEELIRDTFGDAKENDTALIYFSTHGILFQEDGRRHMALLLSDGEQEERLEPEQLRKMLDSVPGRKILILDACHSGAVIGAGADDFVNYFRGLKYEVLVSCGAEEDSWFWSTETDAYTGTGYFTAALENALRASDPEQIDPDGNGEVSLKELAGRIREIYGVSTAVMLPEEDEETLFLLPEAQTQERLLDLRFDPETEEGTLQFHFRTETQVKLEYRLVPMGENDWDFSRVAKIPDRERSGQKRGVVSPGEKDRSIRVSRERLGEDGKALLQIVSWRGLYGQIPVPEATYIIRSN